MKGERLLWEHSRLDFMGLLSYYLAHFSWILNGLLIVIYLLKARIKQIYSLF